MIITHLRVLFVVAIIVAQARIASASCGIFEVSKGDVKVQSADGKLGAASIGSKICSGETVIAADQARAKIHMEDGNELNISPNSKIVIEMYQYDAGANKKKVLLNVLKGKVRATTVRENMYNDKAKDGQANTFQVRTKSAVAGVRGTDFLTSFDVLTGKTDVITFRGKVEVGLLGPTGAVLNPVQVAVGQRTEVSANAAPSTPKALPPSDLTRINIETRNDNVTGPAHSGPSSELNKHPDAGSEAPAPPVAATPAPNASNPTTATPSRDPASPPITACSMCAADLPTAANPTVELPKLPVNPPVMALPPTLTTNPFVTTAVQNAQQNANVRVNLHLGN